MSSLIRALYNQFLSNTKQLNIDYVDTDINIDIDIDIDNSK